MRLNINTFSILNIYLVSPPVACKYKFRKEATSIDIEVYTGTYCLDRSCVTSSVTIIHGIQYVYILFMYNINI